MGSCCNVPVLHSVSEFLINTGYCSEIPQEQLANLTFLVTDNSNIFFQEVPRERTAFVSGLFRNTSIYLCIEKVLQVHVPLTVGHLIANDISVMNVSITNIGFRCRSGMPVWFQAIVLYIQVYFQLNAQLIVMLLFQLQTAAILSVEDVQHAVKCI
jgi:hypothetical protein